MIFFLWIKNEMNKGLRLLAKYHTLLISIAALIVAIVSMDNANEQFETNSIASDSLFNVQLNRASQN